MTPESAPLRQLERGRLTVGIGERVDFGRQTTARAPQRSTLLHRIEALSKKQASESRLPLIVDPYRVQELTAGA